MSALAEPTDSCVLRAIAKPNNRIGVMITAEELHDKNAASLEKLEHGNARKFAKTHDELAGPAGSARPKMTGPSPGMRTVWSLP